MVLRAHHELSSQDQLEALNWLLLRQRIVFKVAVLTYTTYRIQHPAYLHCSLHPYQPCRTLHSASQHLFQIPWLNFGRRFFSYASAETWNNLPDTVKTPLHSPQSKLVLNPTCLTWSDSIIFGHVCIIRSRLYYYYCYCYCYCYYYYCYYYYYYYS